MTTSLWTASAQITTGAASSEWAGLVPNRFVSPSASGGGTGTSASPWTMFEAMDRAVPGDTVGIYPGVYVGTQPDYGDDQALLRMLPAFVPTNNGTSSNPMIFVAQWPAALHTDAALYTELRSGGTEMEYDSAYERDARRGWPVFGGSYWSGGDHCQWLGIYSDESAPQNRIYEDCGICTIRGTDDVTVRFCRLRGDLLSSGNGNNYSAVRLEETWNPIITDNHISRFGSGNGNCQGITFYHARNYLVEHNYIEKVTEGLHNKGGADENDVWGITRFNHYYDCIHAYKFSGPTYGPQGQRNPYHNELIVDCGHWYQFTTGGGITYHEGIDFYNNTIVNTGSSPAQWPGACYFQAISSSYDGLGTNKNNIYYNLNKYLGIGYSVSDPAQKVSNWGTYDFNCLFGMSDPFDGMGSIDLAGWRSTYGQDTHSITQDPQFVGAGDYRLQAGSPARAGQGGIPMGCYITGNEVIGIRA